MSIGFIVFAANAALLVLQLMAGRLLSPFVGSSLATWTAVIGMFLAGISAGNWYGGRIADRAANARTLRLILLAGGLCVLAVLGLVKLCSDGAILRPIPLPLRIVVTSFVVCFPPAFVLSLTTPVAIKILLPDVGHTGRIAGIVYAVGTLGSLVGNFAAGFYLIAYFGVTAITLGVAGVLLVLAVCFRVRSVSEGSLVHASRSEKLIDSSESLGLVTACAIVFFCSFGSMALELGASRVLAPSVGVSLFTWTGIFGVVLAGITVGNFLGGWIADRSPKRATLGSTLFWTGLFTLAILLSFAAFNSVSVDLPQKPTSPGWEIFTGAFWQSVWDWVLYPIAYGVSLTHHQAILPVKILIMASVMFFAPMVAFGTISPQVTRLAVRDWNHAGSVAGRVYAWSCAGAIAGTFATGWFLIGHFGVLRLILGLSVALIAMSLPVGNLWRKSTEVIGCAMVIAAAVYATTTETGKGWRSQLRFDRDAIYERETNYYLVRVTEDYGAPEDGVQMIRKVCLDQLIHSHVGGEYVRVGDDSIWETDVSYLGYGHEKVQAEFARAAAGVHGEPNVLVIGGGGYTFPRWVDRFVPKATVEVVEIDPGVTEAAYQALGLPRDTRIKTYNRDGRQFVQEFAQPGRYHLVVQDAVNDLSVPSHIMTQEYNRAVKRILTDDGIYLLTVIDRFGAKSGKPPLGRLLPAAIRTMQAEFPYVYLLSERIRWDEEGQGVFVIAGMTKPWDVGKFHALLWQQDVKNVRTTAMPEKQLADYVAGTRAVLLSDDFAPTDNLIAETFLKRGE
ncbi:MAG: fused MFS/spermidine synthase [Gemmataceae bacterium]